MLQQRYQTASTSVAVDGAKNATPGRLEFTVQEMSFIASMAVQFVTLIVSIVALAQGGIPPVLMTIVVLELVVQVVELCWYSVVGGMYFFGYASISIVYRYIDWMITTPVMMTSILLFVLWDADKECHNVLNEGSRVAALVIIILMDLLMLLVGFGYEAKVEPLMNFFNMILEPCFSGVKNVGLYLGFLPFLGAFVPLFVIVAQPQTNTGWGVTSVLITFFLWALYGVVAILGARGWDEATRNTGYNILDIFSKNAVGLIISSVAIGNTFDTTTPSSCTA